MAGELFADVPTVGARSNQYGPSIAQFHPGAIFKCRYMFYKRDPFPYVLCCRVDPRLMLVSGVNFRYLTADNISHLIDLLLHGTAAQFKSLRAVCEQVDNAYRSYKLNGLRQVRFADFKYLAAVAQTVRSIDPHENEAIRQDVERQLKRAVNPTASQMTGPAAPTPGQSASIPPTGTT